VIAKEEGAKRALMLPVSVPSHCSLMAPAAEKLKALMAQMAVNVPAIPVINNVDVRMESDPEAIREALARQLYSPVRWVETVQSLSAQGVDRLVECGPGKVLVGLNKRIEKGMTAQPVFDPATLHAALAE
jgi:[acyl-carrier-protein] S-malonyltransferase